MTLGPITLEEGEKLKFLVQTAEKIADLGVTPLRTWLLVARCEDHGRVQSEDTISASSIKCFLCALNPWKYAMKAVSLATVLRG